MVLSLNLADWYTRRQIFLNSTTTLGQLIERACSITFWTSNKFKHRFLTNIIRLSWMMNNRRADKYLTKNVLLPDYLSKFFFILTSPAQEEELFKKSIENCPELHDLKNRCIIFLASHSTPWIQARWGEPQAKCYLNCPIYIFFPKRTVSRFHLLSRKQVLSSFGFWMEIKMNFN